MKALSRCLFLVLGFSWIFCLGLTAAEPIKPAEQAPALPDLAEYRTLDKAVTTRVSQAGPTPVAAQAGYLGIHVTPTAQGKLAVSEVAPDSPAGKAGLAKGDVLVRIGTQEIASADALRECLLSRPAGDVVKIVLARNGKPMEVSATLTAVSRPMKLGVSDWV